jgi:L-aspartate semialdehyde sulfurtransferase ferredoxin
MKIALDMSLPNTLLKEPVIFQLARKFDLVFNLSRASVTATGGKIVLELEGSEAIVKEAVAWLKEKGVQAAVLAEESLEEQE